MLILSRKEGQSIVVGDEIRITIVRVSGSNGDAAVKIGITAPKNIRVDRDEVRLRIAADAAAGTDAVLFERPRIQRASGEGEIRWKH